MDMVETIDLPYQIRLEAPTKLVYDGICAEFLRSAR